MGMMLTAEQLGIGYPGFAVGRGIDLSVDAGQVLCLLGPNGSGKTTLFKTLLGLLPPQAGTVRLRGETLGALARRDVARRIAYVPQAHTAFFPYRVIDMVLMGRTAHLGPFAAPGPADRARAFESLAALGITHLAEAEYTRISGGQRQLALIARALAQDAPILVMDEPTASLDFGNQVLVLGHVRRLARAGLAIVLSTHDPDHVFACASIVAMLADGRIVARGTPTDVVTPERLRQVYGVSVSVQTLPDGQTICVPDLDSRDGGINADARRGA